ncbi:RNA polymerase sigma factor [Nocardioides coralli]|uniref:RNA polymerase sigma factor n=1 Tax=Nocardioides coralli TaxID=2872154 RepID=UPI001CA396BE|nr:sigma-70 family RNA polymerase sigma factor [Nocardioides coralli]QZY28351.1 sigma-70 family RNA polymerase sigma factor [Nocardioides coralli]
MTSQRPEAAVEQILGSGSPSAAAGGADEVAEAAIEVLFHRHHAALLRAAFAVLGSREGAEDAVQDAFVSLYRHWGRLRDPAAAEAYLRSAVLNRCRSGIRSRIRDRSMTAAVGVPLHVVDTAETAQRHHDVALVGPALRRLPRRQREVVVCRYLLELSVAETAETLGISDGAVKRHTHRGLHALHTALEVTR